MIAPSEKSAFSVRAIARLYGVSRGTISDAIRSGELRAARLGKRRYLITKDDWLDFHRRRSIRPDTDPHRVAAERLERERAAS